MSLRLVSGMDCNWERGTYSGIARNLIQLVEPKDWSWSPECVSYEISERLNILPHYQDQHHMTTGK